jgi:hypothetical protein
MSNADYTKEENFKIEFEKNLSTCINEYKKLFPNSSLTCVCAPGDIKIIIFLV